jgi:hypothetical protein
MTKTIEDMIERLQQLGRKAAQDAANRDDLDTLGKTREAIRQVLMVLDGKTPHFPRCSISPSPHPDDIADAVEAGERYYDPEICYAGPLAEKFANTVYDDLDIDRLGTTPYTADEITKDLLNHFSFLAKYWAEINNGQSDLERCEGAVFSFFVTFDGSNLAMPMMDIIPSAEDIAARPEVSDFEPVKLDGYIHDNFFGVEAFEEEEPGPSL